MVIRIDNFVQKQSGFGWGRFYVRIYGNIDIIDLASAKTVCSIEINGLSGSADYVQNDRMAKSFTELGEKLAEVK